MQYGHYSTTNQSHPKPKTVYNREKCEQYNTKRVKTNRGKLTKFSSLSDFLAMLGGVGSCAVAENSPKIMSSRKVSTKKINSQKFRAKKINSRKLPVKKINSRKLPAKKINSI